MLLEQEHEHKIFSKKKKMKEFLVPLGVYVHLLLYMSFFTVW